MLVSPKSSPCCEALELQVQDQWGSQNEETGHKTGNDAWMGPLRDQGETQAASSSRLADHPLSMEVTPAMGQARR
jgi:hypothetical protein